MWAVCALSGAGLIAAAVAVFTTYWVSVAAWLLLMIGGCGLLFYRRIDAISATRHAGGIGAASLQTIEKVAVGVLVLACFVNGLVIAWEIAAWPLWAEWLGTE